MVKLKTKSFLSGGIINERRKLYYTSLDQVRKKEIVCIILFCLERFFSGMNWTILLNELGIILFFVTKCTIN